MNSQGRIGRAILVGNMDIYQAVILGLVQGVTEFLPVSSSGHLVLARALLGMGSDGALAFDVMLHVATLGAVLVYFSKDIWVLVQAVLRKLGRLPVNHKDMVMVYALLIGTIPAGLLGFFLESVIETYFQHPLIVAGILFTAALFFMYAEWHYFSNPREFELTPLMGFKIGLFQALALLPGFSRSGATIAGGMILGLSRYESSRFSFLLAIPIIIGAGLKESLDIIKANEPLAFLPMFIGGLVAFLVALLVIHVFLQFIRRYTLWPFIWYTILMAMFVGYVYMIA